MMAFKMKFACTIPVILAALLFYSGCSQDKPDNYQGKNVARMRITKPAKEVKAEKDAAEEAAGSAGQAVDQEIEQEIIITESPPESKRDVYVTEKGETLLDISGKAEIHNNPLKWTFLYRNNIEALSSIKGRAKPYETPLPEGTSLKITPPDKRKENLEQEQGAYYTVNALSSPSLDEVGPHCVKLIDAGYYAYITTAVVHDRAYYRLRTGFYKTRAEADVEGGKIKKILNISDIWTAKIDDAEFSDHGG